MSEQTGSPSKRQRMAAESIGSIASIDGVASVKTAIDALDRANRQAVSLQNEKHLRDIARHIALAMTCPDLVNSMYTSLVAPRQREPDFAAFIAFLFLAVFEECEEREGEEGESVESVESGSWEIIGAICTAIMPDTEAIASLVAHSIAQLVTHSDETRASAAAMLAWMDDSARGKVTINSRHLGELIVVTAIQTNNVHLAVAMMKTVAARPMEPETERELVRALLLYCPDPEAAAALALNIADETMQWVGGTMFGVPVVEFDYARMIKSGNPFRRAVLHALGLGTGNSNVLLEDVLLEDFLLADVVLADVVPANVVLAKAAAAQLLADCADFSNPTSAQSAREICAADTLHACAPTVGALLFKLLGQTSAESGAALLLYDTYGHGPFVDGECALRGIVQCGDAATLATLLLCSSSFASVVLDTSTGDTIAIEAIRSHGTDPTNPCLAAILAADARGAMRANGTSPQQVAVATRSMATVGIIAKALDGIKASDMRLIVDATTALLDIPLVAHHIRDMRHTAANVNHWGAVLPFAIGQIGTEAVAAESVAVSVTESETETETESESESVAVEAEAVKIVKFMLSINAAEPFYTPGSCLCGDEGLLTALTALSKTATNLVQCHEIALCIGKHAFLAYLRIVCQKRAPFPLRTQNPADLAVSLSCSFSSTDTGLAPSTYLTSYDEGVHDRVYLLTGIHMGHMIMQTDPVVGTPPRFCAEFIENVVTRVNPLFYKSTEEETNQYKYYMRAIFKTREGLHSLVQEDVLIAMGLVSYEGEFGARINGTWNHGTMETRDF